MKILYDLIYLEKERHGGISRMWTEYFKEIFRSNLKVSFLSKSQVSNTTQSYLKSVNYYNNMIIYESSYSSDFLMKISQLNFFRNILLMLKIPNNIDIFHSTGYANPLIKRNNLKIVTTIHDMVFWDQKSNMAKGVSYWDNVWGIQHSLRISDRVVTVSNASKKSIIKHFPWAEEKIDVIYHGLPEDFLNIDVQMNKEKYFMFIGGRNEYKNYDLLLRSFSLFTKEYPEWKLCVVGQNNHTVEIENKRYSELDISDKVDDYGLVDQNVMIGLIQKATAVVIPSLNEGFNFPLIEGMACGAPVLSSNIPVSQEIGKDYVKYFNNNEQSLLRLMKDVSENSTSYNKLEQARNYARTFNWNNSYKKLMKVYNSCI
jgi:glycosyltransferase involved in cell wall biosynthesis